MRDCLLHGTPDKTAEQITARDCALMLLETVPAVMRNIAEATRQRRPQDDEIHTMAQFHLLGTLRGRPSSLRDLAAAHHVTPSTLSRSIDVLVRKGWVARAADPEDRRQIILRVTDEGTTAHTAMIESVQDAVTEFMARLNEDRLGTLYAGLRTLHDLFAPAMDDDRAD